MKHSKRREIRSDAKRQQFETCFMGTKLQESAAIVKGTHPSVQQLSIVVMFQLLQDAKTEACGARMHLSKLMSLSYQKKRARQGLGANPFFAMRLTIDV